MFSGAQIAVLLSASLMMVDTTPRKESTDLLCVDLVAELIT